MRPIKALLMVCICASLFSCKKSSTKPTVATTVEVNVTDGITNTAASSATVNLYATAAAVTSNTPAYTQATDASGKAKITLAFLSNYYVVVVKGSERNYFNGLIPIGIFKSQTDIDSSPNQTPAGVVGGVKFLDTNGDGIITTPQDAVAAPSVSLTQNTNTAFSTTVY